MTQLATQLSRELRGIPGVDNVGAHVGRAIGSDQVGDVNSSEVWVSIDSGADYDATLASIEDTVGPRAQRARTTSSPTRRRRSRTSGRCRKARTRSRATASTC